ASIETAMMELRGAIEVHATTEEIKEERRMLRSILDLNDVEVADVMTHRRTVVTLDAATPAGELVDQILKSPFTRLPVWCDNADNIVGVVHAKDVLRAVRALGGEVEKLDIRELASPPWFIPDSTTLLEQLTAFRTRREHFALVVDEYGALQGVVTLEDILEEIVGDIADEHDVAVAGVRPQADGSYVVDGSVTIRDLNREFEWRLPDEEAATIAGLVLHESRQIPTVGQTFRFYGFRFEILRRHRNQITSIRIRPEQVSPDSEED
ncbi:MAG TPA: transporter associated domain-containing protein, partial [Candidatus Omnitrophota bacterium]|nr:transporter associated domain-containing protein [Candidatus Omnitrophota bacterium]